MTSINDFTSGARFIYNDGQYWSTFVVEHLTKDTIRATIINSNEYKRGEFIGFDLADMKDWITSGFIRKV